MNLNVLDRALPGPMSLPLLKRASKRALQYLYEECGIIHTGKCFTYAKFFFSKVFSDIKGDNILIASAPPE